MSSTFSASEAIDLLIRLGWSFNGVAEWVVVGAPGDRSGVGLLLCPHSCVLKGGWYLDKWRYWEGWREQEGALSKVWRVWHRGGWEGVHYSESAVQLKIPSCITSPSLPASISHCQEIGAGLSTHRTSVLGCPLKCWGRLNARNAWIPSHVDSDMLPCYNARAQKYKSLVEQIAQGLRRTDYFVQCNIHLDEFRLPNRIFYLWEL